MDLLGRTYLSDADELELATLLASIRLDADPSELTRPGRGTTDQRLRDAARAGATPTWVRAS